MVLLGCRLKGRHTEQHDIFFGIANTIGELVPSINKFWPEAKGRIHVDAWREVTQVDGYAISVVDKTENTHIAIEEKLYFINLGGYKENEFEEFHYKTIVVGKSMTDASSKAKETTFYKHCGIPGGQAHIDDKYGIDIDDIYNVENILSIEFTSKYSIKLQKSNEVITNRLNLGYFKLNEL